MHINFLPFFFKLCLRPGITRQWGADKSPLDEGHLYPCCSLKSTGEENGPLGRTLASGAAGPSCPGRPEPPPGMGGGGGGSGDGGGAAGTGRGDLGLGAGSANETRWKDLRLLVVTEELGSAGYRKWISAWFAC